MKKLRLRRNQLKNNLALGRSWALMEDRLPKEYFLLSKPRSLVLLFILELYNLISGQATSLNDLIQSQSQRLGCGGAMGYELGWDD